MNNIIRNISQVPPTTTWSFDPPYIILTIAVNINEHYTEKICTRHLIYLEQQYTILVPAPRVHIEGITTDGTTRTRHCLHIVVHYIYIVDDGHSSDNDSESSSESESTASEQL